MKVIFETAPLPSTARLPNGNTVPGVLNFQVQLYTPGEEGSVLRNGNVPAIANQWLKQVNARDKVVIGPPPESRDALPVEIPAGLLRVLPPDAQVVMEWTWRRVR